jgi:hypothetical protein
LPPPPMYRSRQASTPLTLATTRHPTARTRRARTSNWLAAGGVGLSQRSEVSIKLVCTNLARAYSMLVPSCFHRACRPV